MLRDAIEREVCRFLSLQRHWYAQLDLADAKEAAPEAQSGECEISCLESGVLAVQVLSEDPDQGAVLFRVQLVPMV